MEQHNRGSGYHSDAISLTSIRRKERDLSSSKRVIPQLHSQHKERDSVPCALRRDFSVDSAAENARLEGK
jgi:hypothetical protein